MSVRFQADQLASPPAATNVETVDAAGGVRQVVTIGSFGAFGSETQLSAGQKTMTASIPVVLASDQSSLTVSGTITANQGGAWAVGQSGSWTTRVVGNSGATLDAAVAAGTAPTNMLAVGGLYNATEIGPTTGQSAALQLDSKGRLRQVIMDAAGNTRGANVNSSNQLSVSVDAIVANQSVNLAQVNAAAVSTAASGVQKVGVTGNAGAAFDQATGSAVPSNALYNGINVAGNLRGATGVNPSGTVYASQVDLTSVAGTTCDVSAGTKSAGTQRVTLATDQTTLTNLVGQVSTSAETATVYNGTTALTPSFATVVASASGATSIVSAVASKRIRVLAVQLVANAAVNVKWQSHTTPTDLTGLAYLAANGGYVLPFNPVGWFQTNSGEQLDINLSGAVAVGGCVVYVTV
jgi:hypothetical protein